PAKAIKEGQVKKNKQPKFKQTPKGKVQLVHDKKNGNANAQKAINNSPKKNSSNNKQPDNKNSLADDTDDDDDDFEADSDEEASSKVKKGVKMFKGLKPVKKNESAEEEDDDDDDEDDDDDDDDDDEMDQSIADTDGPGLKALLGNSLVDEDDDEDFEGDENDDDDDEEIESDDEDEPLNASAVSNNSTISTASSEEKVLSPEEKAEVDKRSIYVGNVPKDIKESRIKSEFNKFGPIESLRIRGVIPESPKISYKTAAIKRKMHDKCKSICVFIVFKAEESAVKALAMNGQQLEGFYLRVDRVNQEKKRDPKKSVFLGNLPFDTEDNELWDMFLKCGKIEDVRTVRDRASGGCRGIAYINFKTEDGATLALNLDDTEFRKRKIRVKRYQPQQPGSKQGKPKFGNKRPHNNKHQGGSPKKNKKNDDVKRKPRDSSEAAKKSPAQSDDSFQGQTADAKKKGKKANKFEKKKKNMAGKLMSKPKKPIS
ncbi:GSCOCG00008112001-RA-CDS, partial [Cotesia congregata]